MLQATNGNIYKSSTVDGTQGGGSLKRKQNLSKQPSKYVKFDDMKLTSAQKKQLAALNKRNATRHMELKYVDTAVFGTVTSATWQLTQMSVPTIGTGDTQRTGDQISLKNIELRWSAYLPSGFVIVNGSSSVRVVIFQWYSDTFLGAPSGLDVFQTTGLGTSILAPYTHDKRQDFKILYDEVVCLSTNGPDATDRVVLVQPGKKKLQYVNSGLSGTNNIFLAIISSDNTANAPLIDYYCRVNYYDA